LPGRSPPPYSYEYYDHCGPDCTSGKGKGKSTSPCKLARTSDSVLHNIDALLAQHSPVPSRRRSFCARANHRALGYNVASTGSPVQSQGSESATDLGPSREQPRDTQPSITRSDRAAPTSVSSSGSSRSSSRRRGRPLLPPRWALAATDQLQIKPVIASPQKDQLLLTTNMENEIDERPMIGQGAVDLEGNASDDLTATPTSPTPREFI